MDKRTLKKFDRMCLTPVQPILPKEIREIRTREMVSQAVFALHLNITTGLVSKWERGDNHPTGPSLKLLRLVQKNGRMRLLKLTNVNVILWKVQLTSLHLCTSISRESYTSNRSSITVC